MPKASNIHGCRNYGSIGCTCHNHNAVVDAIRIAVVAANLGWLAYCDHANARWYGLAVVLCAVPSVGALALRSLLYK